MFVNSCISLQAKQIFVSTNGNDTNTGTIESPLWSVQKAQSKASAEDTVYIRGGNYIIAQSDISKVETAYLNGTQNILVTNSFEMNLVLTDDDFISLEESELIAPRKADGSLPDINFMNIAPSSTLMNAGTDIGFPFFGDAPEPGAFEQSLPVVGIEQLDYMKRIIYPNPAKDFLFINDMAIQQAWITDISGRQQQMSVYENIIDVSPLENGIYVLNVITNQNKSIAKKVIILK